MALFRSGKQVLIITTTPLRNGDGGWGSAVALSRARTTRDWSFGLGIQRPRFRLVVSSIASVSLTKYSGSTTGRRTGNSLCDDRKGDTNMASISATVANPTASDPIVFFDIPSRPPARCWSLNMWKTRMLLNYKGLEYTTQWLEYPEIRPMLEGRVELNPPPATPYTLPAIKLPDGTYIQDSRKIAARLEELYSDAPPIHPVTPYIARMDTVMPQLQRFGPAFVNKIPARLLNEGSLEYWHRTRSEAIGGMSLEQCEREQGDAAFGLFEPAVREVTAMLTEHPEGPFFEGKDVTYTDFVWASMLKMMERLGDDMLEGILAVSGDREAHLKLFEACRPWLRRED